MSMNDMIKEIGEAAVLLDALIESDGVTLYVRPKDQFKGRNLSDLLGIIEGRKTPVSAPCTPKMSCDGSGGCACRRSAPATPITWKDIAATMRKHNPAVPVSVEELFNKCVKMHVNGPNWDDLCRDSVTGAFILKEDGKESKERARAAEVAKTAAKINASVANKRAATEQLRFPKLSGLSVDLVALVDQLSPEQRVYLSRLCVSSK